MRRSRLQRWKAKLLALAALALVSTILSVAGGTVAVVGTLEYTARPDFCLTCHIMEPYYESWESSSHAHVGCIECHYEPGAVETLEGKFKALSQLSKYVTRTQGTKPWAEVSDQSCMRSGCHSVRMLEGPIEFGDVKFDHRHHLLESRRGRRLRCVSCHSQIVQGDHIAVTESVCFTCHFMPGVAAGISGPIDDCMVCHGPPVEPIDVAGQTFEHAEYLARGVGCKDCHDPVIQGEGTVRRERCHSCHGEVGHIDRIGETAFMHEKHVTDHKVECFECHDEIFHGLLPLERPEQATTEGCGSCHVTPHDGASLLYAGMGAVGLEDDPSRMYETRVVCGACHTGRSGYSHDGKKVAGARPGAVGAMHATAGPHGSAPQASAASAAEVDCLHCHGVGAAGMLAGWQGAVGGQLERLRPLLEGLAEAADGSDDERLRTLYDDARANFELVVLDGSRGVHNPTYALDALRLSAGWIEEAYELVDPGREVSALESFPFQSKDGCSTCHLGVELVPVSLGTDNAFSHARHLQDAGLECAACHTVAEHGSPDHGRLAYPRSQCAECHHTESETLDPYDCARCHGGAQTFFEGELAGFADTPVHMQDKECTACHGEPPDIMLPPGAMCALCHEEGFDAMLAEWQGAVGGGLDALLAATAEFENAAEGDAAEALNAIHRDLGLVARDGARGAHNPALSLDLLRAAATRLDEAWTAEDPDRAASALDLVPPPVDPACAGCHLDVSQHDPIALEDGGTFRHGPHLRLSGLDCATCHVAEPLGEDGHGQPAFPRSECSQCHHTETDTLDPWECATCHAAQQDFYAGTLAELADAPVHMPDKECTDCHGEPPDILVPPEAMCVLCHDDEYGDMLTEWRTTTQSLGEELSAALAAPPAGASPAALEGARRALDLVGADGSNGVHNFLLAERLLREALEGLK